MTFSKAPKALILLVILALAGTVAVAGCGGGDSTTSETATEESAAPPAEEEGAEEEPAEEAEEEEPAEEKEEEPAEGEAEGGGEAAAGGEGKTIFTTNCATCHTLKAAGASGEVGPNLDELEPDEATVEKQVTNGGGGMPAFGGTLSPGEIKEVAAYVSTEAGK
jgi:mono/diheme cytochrome c family protein